MVSPIIIIHKYTVHLGTKHISVKQNHGNTALIQVNKILLVVFDRTGYRSNYYSVNIKVPERIENFDLLAVVFVGTAYHNGYIVFIQYLLHSKYHLGIVCVVYVRNHNTYYASVNTASFCFSPVFSDCEVVFFGYFQDLLPRTFTDIALVAENS